MRTHPNTIAAGTTGTFAILITWLMDAFGLKVDQAAAAAIAVAIIVVVLFIGRRGLTGITRLLWKGDPDL